MARRDPSSCFHPPPYPFFLLLLLLLLLLFGLFMRDAVMHAVVKGGRCGIPCHRGSRLGAVNADPF